MLSFQGLSSDHIDMRQPTPAPATTAPATATSPAVTQPAVSVDAIKQACGIDDVNEIRRILALFAPHALQHLSEIDRAITRSDAEALTRVTHRFKSSSRFIGAYPLGDLLETLEHQAQNGGREPARLTELRDRIVGEVRQVLKFIEVYSRG